MDSNAQSSAAAPLPSSDYRFRFQDAYMGAQMLFVAFGALVLVPILTGLNPNVALFTAGLGTLIFQVVTKGKVPVFLASSFAFIAPIQLGVAEYGLPGTLSGLAAAGLLYLALSALIKWRGSEIILRVLPSIVTGPVIMVIGLILAPVAVEMATSAAQDQSYSALTAAIVAFVSTLATLLVMLLGRGTLRMIPILIGIAAGYVFSLPLGLVDLSPVAAAPWFQIPNFVAPEFNLAAILFILPVAIAPAIEHFGDILAIGSVTGKNYLQNPGIQRTMLGDGLATIAASSLGGPPNTTYSEVTGAVTITRAFNPAIMTWAAIAAILLAFVGKLGALLQTIPVPVMGGILLLLFASIIVIGLNTLARSGRDLTEPRNLIIIGLILVCGVGGMTFSYGEFSLEGIGLAGLLGVLLNLLLPHPQGTPKGELEAAAEIRKLN